ncbi:copper amine oxidase N-terminal domain-containing protein [Paenibacillus sp. D2_2]|uniref:copper amine oxidase N-terminal domain-containing protein n=1 Tax=Paenibacillus sp. D2_2 TaxID=3073092 RepID=UPI002814CC61|nr:copper amine oxidase N-terminal domain-containing protein [Paenibacillus sp. D2_2]WMT38890.1 copper amine oxidase N-terminal domain-containing protein [Paenibacillus sp. D2_2]
MIRKFLVSLLSFCLLVTTQHLIGVASADKSIQLYVNNVKIAGVHPIVMSGVMYAPYRSFFSALGYKVAYDPGTGQISGVINGAEIQFWAGEDIIEYDDAIYYLDNTIPVINGHVYLPLRLISNLAKYSVNYDKSSLTVNLKPYGYGEESAIIDLLTKYYKTYSPLLYTFDNLKRRYMNLEYDYEANQPVSEITVRDFKVTIDRIKYTSASEARVQVTYIKNTEVLNQSDVYIFDIRYERGQWKIADEASVYSHTELPEDIDKQAASIMKNRYDEQNEVLSDLRTYYQALNEKNLDLIIQYTDPTFIQQWKDKSLFGDGSWEDFMREEILPFSSERRILLNERVVYLGDKEAVVQCKLDFSIDKKDGGRDNRVSEDLIYLKYANGHWTISDDFDLDLDFDKRVDSEGNTVGWYNY